MDIYRAAERRGKYPTLVTDTEGDNCFSICLVSEIDMENISFKCSKIVKMSSTTSTMITHKILQWT